MTVYQNIPLGNAVSRVTIAGDFLEIKGTARCYDWAYGERSALRLGKINDSIRIDKGNRATLASLLQRSREPYNPGMDFCEMRVCSDSDYLGTRTVQMPDLSGDWCRAGLSVFRDGNRAMLYARLDTGRGMDEREAYDTIVPLTQEECMQLVRRLEKSEWGITHVL